MPFAPMYNYARMIRYVPMNMLIPTVQRFGNRYDCVSIVSGITSLTCRNERCPEITIELDGYYETNGGDRVKITVLIPLHEFVTIAELYELAAMKDLGVPATIAELRHGKE